MAQVKLVREFQSDELRCPRCSSTLIVKTGHTNAGKQYHTCKNCGRVFVIQPERQSAKNVLPDNLTVAQMKSYDIWDVRVFGKEPDTSGVFSLNFSLIKCDWIREAIKEFLWSRITLDATGTLRNKLINLRKISSYVEQANLKPEEINRGVILDFLVYVSAQKISSARIRNIIGDTKTFLEYCQRNEVIKIPKERLIFSEDNPQKITKTVKDIPPDVIKQLEDNLHYLPQPIALMVKILKETGMRASEVCGLKFNCIRQDGDGDWWLELYRFKMKREDRLVITKELALGILEQQKFIRSKLGKDYLYLFCDNYGAWFRRYTQGKSRKSCSKKELYEFEPTARKIPQTTLRGYLHQLAHERNITDVSGEIYPIWKCHRFRHTHLTECARKGMSVPHIMQRAGHTSPDMSMRYIHLTSDDQKQKIKEVWDNTHFNIEGEIVASPNPDLDTADLQWIKKGMQVQTSDNGYCTLLFTQTCPHQNLPCKECNQWVTTLEFLEAHKKELEDTEKIIENARQKGWKRQVERNVPRAERLKKIINSLEEYQHMKGLGHNDWEQGGKNDV